jgi:hypothetical protein
MMLYHGLAGELGGFVYFQCGSDYRWFPLPDDDAMFLRDYVAALIDLRESAPEIIKLCPIETFSPRLKLLKSMSDATKGRVEHVERR